MEFTVPQFIEKEAKIVGPFTFKQFVFIGAAGGISIFLYLTLPPFISAILILILMGAAFALSFLKIEKTSLPEYITNFFIFLFRPKIYLWKKKTGSPKFLRKEKIIVKELIKKESPGELKVSRGSRLDKLFTKLETK